MASKDQIALSLKEAAVSITSDALLSKEPKRGQLLRESLRHSVAGWILTDASEAQVIEIYKKMNVKQN